MNLNVIVRNFVNNLIILLQNEKTTAHCLYGSPEGHVRMFSSGDSFSKTDKKVKVDEKKYFRKNLVIVGKKLETFLHV